jgi:hypothetical protein
MTEFLDGDDGETEERSISRVTTRRRSGLPVSEGQRVTAEGSVAELKPFDGNTALQPQVLAVSVAPRHALSQLHGDRILPARLRPGSLLYGRMLRACRLRESS